MINDYQKVLALVEASNTPQRLDDCKDAAEIFLEKYRTLPGIHKYYEKILNAILAKENIID